MAMMAALLLTAGPADAAKGTVVSASRSGYVDVTLTRDTPVDLSAFSVPQAKEIAGYFMMRRGERYTVTGAHSAGFYVKGLAGPDDPHGSLTLGYRREVLSAGRYRLSIIVDRPMSMTLPFTVDSPQRLQLRPVAWRSEAAPISTSGVGDVASERAVKVTPASTVISVAGQYSGAGATVQSLSACVTPGPVGEGQSGCPQGEFAGVTTSTGLRYGVGVIATYGPGQIPAGPAVARGNATTAGTSTRAVTAFIMFDSGL